MNLLSRDTEGVRSHRTFHHTFQTDIVTILLPFRRPSCKKRRASVSGWSGGKERKTSHDGTSRRPDGSYGTWLGVLPGLRVAFGLHPCALVCIERTRAQPPGVCGGAANVTANV